jgi:hypothetical protein
MTGFWIGIAITVLIVVGLSVVVGKALSKPKGGGGDRSSRHAEMTALKVSGALKHRKSNRN